MDGVEQIGRSLTSLDSGATEEEGGGREEEELILIIILLREFT